MKTADLSRLRPLLQLPANNLEQLVIDLLARFERAQSGSPEHVPMVTLHLRGGHNPKGHLLARREEGGPATLLLHIPGEMNPARTDALVVPQSEVLAITVHEVAQLAIQRTP